MAPGGVETSVFHNTVFPESAQVDFSNDTLFKVVGLSLEPLHFKADLVEHTTCVNQTAASGFGGRA